MIEYVKGRFKVFSLLGKGSFGKIYLAQDRDSGKLVAVKIEKKDRLGYLFKEAEFLQELSGVIGVPNLLLYGKDSDFDFLAMELLGLSIEQLYIYCGKKISLKSTLLLADQMIERLQQVHERGVLHRDLKPHNFVVGINEKSSLIYLLDFGLAKYFIKKDSGHIQFRDDKYMIGTVRYASLNNQRGLQQSRRDDLESLGYVLLYLVKGGLPWQGLHASSTNERKRKILEKKLEILDHELCEGLPVEFQQYLSYTKSLGFFDKPDYAYLKRLFKNVFMRMDFAYDFVFDWKVLNTN